jgi:threonine/homoserine/homoserine lactone efflux protein
MLMHAIGGMLPAAIAVALSPIPIVAVVMVLATPKARTAGPAFAVGWVVGLTAVSAVVVALAHGSSDPDSATATGVNWLTVGIGVLFLSMARRQWRKRPRAGQAGEVPKWMATLDEVTAAKGLVLGVALSAANPKNLALTAAAAASIAQEGLGTADTIIAVAVFVVIGSCTVAGAVLLAVVAPSWSARPLASVKQFMADNNAVIMMVLLLILGAKFIGDGLSGLWT